MGGAEAALANHLVMGPAILARAGVPFAAKIHGSALSYTVRPHLGRFGPFAQEGVDAARTVLVGSHHTAGRLWETLFDESLPARTRLGPPGVDTEAFAPLPESETTSRLRELGAAVRAAGGGAFGREVDDDLTTASAHAHHRGAAIGVLGADLEIDV